MTALIEQLERDHQQMLRLMYLFKKGLLSLPEKPLQSGQLPELVEILDFVKVYPETWHHPAEDILFAHLRQLPQINTLAIDAVANDHPRLEALSSQLRLIFGELQQAGMPPSGPVLRLAHRFCSEQIAHIHAERTIFAAINARFDPTDWVQVSEAIAQRFRHHPRPGAQAISPGQGLDNTAICRVH